MRKAVDARVDQAISDNCSRTEITVERRPPEHAGGEMAVALPECVGRWRKPPTRRKFHAPGTAPASCAERLANVGEFKDKQIPLARSQ
jgi:hypothetical protein